MKVIAGGELPACRFVDTVRSNCYPVGRMTRHRPATVAVTGAAGMLGQEVCLAAPSWVSLVPLTRAHGDLGEAAGAAAAVGAARPDAVIHCAAFTDVDGATRDPEAARRGNVVATQNVARICDELGARLVHLSTDYVFDGAPDGLYVESTRPSPVNVYGETKLAAEREAAGVRKHLIVRTQWLFGPAGRNFVEAILEAARAGEPLQVVQNEFGRPTYTADLALAIWRMLEASVSGIVHVTNEGTCSRLEFARAALEEAGLEDTPISGIDSDQWPSPTRRPLHAVLASERLNEPGIAPLRHWREALRDYVAKLRPRWDQEADVGG
ncbi:MAG: dTDP-4-dehydrorhamnose reductase [Armatimonadota bacterium]